MEKQFPSFSVLSTFIFFILIILKIWKKKSKTSSKLYPQPPPGPWKLPLIGNIHQLLGSLPHRRLQDFAKTYGPVMQLQFGQVSAIVISSPELAKVVLKTHETNFINRPRADVANVLFYNRQDIAFAPYGDYWKQMRKISIFTMFSSNRVKLFRSVRQYEVSKFIRSIYSKAGSPINISKMMFSLTNSIIARITMGEKCGREEDLYHIVEAWTKAVGGFSVVDMLPSFKLLHLVSGTSGKLKRVHQKADKILEDIINQHKSCKEVSKIDEFDNFLDVLLDLQDNGNLELPLTNDGIKAIILDMITAGSDTSSAILEWAMSEMLKTPRIMKKAQEEVRQVFNKTGNVDEISLQELKFMKSVIKETLRLHPPTPIVPRECEERCEINGYEIQAKVEILVNVWAIGRDPNYWIEPEKFYPERFFDCSIDYKGLDFEFLPFGAGRRICPGILLGMANVEFPLAQLLYHFDWKLSNNNEIMPEDIDMSEAFGAITRRERDLNVIPILYHPVPVEDI